MTVTSLLQRKFFSCTITVWYQRVLKTNFPCCLHFWMNGQDVYGLLPRLCLLDMVGLAQYHAQQEYQEGQLLKDVKN